MSIEKAELVDQIQEIKPRQGRPVLVAISGFGGSGKSTLAQSIARAIEGASVVPIDDFIIGERTQRSSDWRTFDRGRLRREVLEPVRIGENLRYKKFNSGEWSSGKGGAWRELQIGKIVIIEGCGILHPKLMSYYDHSAWIDCSQEAALISSKQRDSTETTLFGADNTDRLWDEVWGPNDSDYFNRFRPDQLADVLVEKQF